LNAERSAIDPADNDGHSVAVDPLFAVAVARRRAHIAWSSAEPTL
jgi:hypothetical protein